MMPPNIVVDKNAPPDAIYLISPRKVITPARVTPEGTVPATLEPESKWAKRCAVITGLKL